MSINKNLVCFFKIIIIFCIISGLNSNSDAASFNVRISREEFADFYGVLIIEDDFKDFPLDKIFTSGFDPLTGKLKNDEIFSVKSPYFEPDALKKKSEITQKIQNTQDAQVQTEEVVQDFKPVYNLKLSSKPQPVIKNNFTENLLAANKQIESGSKEIDISALEVEAAQNPVKLANVAKLYIKIGDLQKAIELLKIAVELAPDDYKILYTYGITLYKNEQLDLAENILLKITQLKSDFMYAYYNLGNIYYKQKNYKKALDYFKKAMELAPDKANIYFNIAITLEQLGYKDIASRFYTKCLEINPNDNEAIKALQRLQ